MAERLYRSPDDKVLAGVAGGVADRLDADPSLVRIIWAVAALVTGGIAIVVYIVMAIVVPYPPDGHVRATRPEPTGWTAPDGSSTFGAPAPRDRDRGRSPAGLVIGLILVAVGAIFLVREFLPEIDLSISWPVLSLIVGLALIVLSIRPGRSIG